MVTSRRNFCSALAKKAYQREDSAAIRVATRATHSYSRASTASKVSPAVVEGLAQPTTSSGAHPRSRHTGDNDREQLISRHRRSLFRHDLPWCQVIFCGEWWASPGPGQ